MNGWETSAGAGDGHGGNRLMLVIADGCRVGVGLESVEGIFEIAPRGEPGTATLPDGESVPLVHWSEIAGVESPREATAWMMLVRTPLGRVGLAADTCLGVRDGAFSGRSLLPTRLRGPDGEPWCFVHLLDRRAHFIVDPRAIGEAAKARPEGFGSAVENGTEHHEA